MPTPPLDAEQLLRNIADALRPVVSANTALVGIHTGGFWVAQRLHQNLAVATPLGALDVSFYRDDFQRIGLHPQVRPSTIPFEVEGRDLILVDDVLYTGRTIRAAMNELFDYGRPQTIRLVVLIDRGGRELPIFAEFVGATLQLRPEQSIELQRDPAGRLSLLLHG